MTEPQINSSLSKSKAQVIFEYILLALCLCVIACRATYTESPNITAPAPLADFSNTIKSLAISAALIFPFFTWLCFSAVAKKWQYRYTGIEVGLLIFLTAGIIGLVIAPNKRAAITDLVTLAAPMLVAILLVQILDCRTKTTLLLYVIVALGVVGTYQCAEQFFSSNEMLIEQYRQAPHEQLSRLGIEPNSFQHFLYEHRLYTKDVRGFFKTGNSAGSFALLAAFAAAGLFMERLNNSRSNPSQRTKTLTTALVTLTILATLALTRSKGTIVAAGVSFAMLLMFLLFGRQLRTHRKAVLLVIMILAVAGGSLLVVYGLHHGKLPGGNSMLVRWQYWVAAAKMFAKHPLTGVGPGTFVHFYPHYKPAGALETVTDPHNFLLSVLTQYGPLGLIGFLAAIVVPLHRVAFSPASQEGKSPTRAAPVFKPLAIIFLVILSVALLVFRPLLVAAELGEKLEVRLYLAIYWYVMPVVAFVLAYLLLSVTGQATRLGHLAVGAFFCGILGFLIHNCIDFAIFEPGILTAFWAIIAALIALDFQQKSRTPVVVKPVVFARILIAAAAVVLIWAYFYYAFIPAAKAAAKTQRAMTNLRYAHYAHELLNEAAEDDRLDPAALNLNGRLYLQHYNETAKIQTTLLKQAEACFLGAIDRNKADFKNYENLSEVYILLAETSTGQERTDYLNKTFDSALLAVEHYPGCGRLRINLAKIAERLHKTDTAIEHYKKAVEIEDSFRSQFRMMYPNRKLVSRLGEEKYQFAKERIKHLSK